MGFIDNIISQDMVQRLGWMLVHFIWQALIVAFLLAIILKILRKSSANLRYMVACLTLVILVLLPVITINLIPNMGPDSPSENTPAPEPVAISPTPAEIEPSFNVGISENIAPPDTLNLPTIEPETSAAAPPVEPETPLYQRISDVFSPILPYIVLGWLVGVFGLSVWYLGGWTQLRRLRQRMVKPVDESLTCKLNELAGVLGIKRAVELVDSALVQTPTVIGWLKPMILLPGSVLTGFSPEQLEAILAHELAHIKRCDYLVNMLQTGAEILGFYHPAVWWISRKIRIERENCCDDIAVKISGDRIGYAKTLALFEGITPDQSDHAVAASGGSLFERIYRLVHKDLPASHIKADWKPSVIAILAIIALLIPASYALTTRTEKNDTADNKEISLHPDLITAEYLLENMLEGRAKAKNLQFISQYDSYRTAVSKAKLEEMKKELRKRGFSEQMIQMHIQGLKKISGQRFQILNCTLNNIGYAKIERTAGSYDLSGKKVFNGDLSIDSWNGISGVQFYKRKGFPGFASIKDTAPFGASRQGHPWKTFTGDFIDALERAITGKKHIIINKQKDGTYYVEFEDGNSKCTATVDPSKGYTCTLEEFYRKGYLSHRRTANYQEVTKEIWFPVSGEVKSYLNDGSLRSRSSITSTQIKINQPGFNASIFEVDFQEGTEIQDYLIGKKYIVGSNKTYDLDNVSEDITDKVTSNLWQEKFNAVYRLEDNEVLKWIEEPFIPERKQYYLNQTNSNPSDASYRGMTRYVFHWEGKLKEYSILGGGSILRLDSVLESVIGLGNAEYQSPENLRHLPIPGDWIIRKGTSKKELLIALENIIHNKLKRNIRFVKNNVDDQVIIVKGKYQFKPLSELPSSKAVHIFTDSLNSGSGGGGGTGTLDDFLKWVGNRIKMNLVNQTDSPNIKLSWRNHDSSMMNRLEHDQTYDKKLQSLLANLEQQTGLTFQRQSTGIWKWFVIEDRIVAKPAQYKINDMFKRDKRVKELFGMYVRGEQLPKEEATSGLTIIPNFTWEDIPALLQLAESGKTLKNMPCLPITSVHYGEGPEGMVALWFIESIRQKQVAAMKKLQGVDNRITDHGLPLYPICIKGNMSAKECANSLEIYREVLKAYQLWWQMASYKSPGEGSVFNPLELTDLKWAGWRRWEHHLDVEIFKKVSDTGIAGQRTVHELQYNREAQKYQPDKKVRTIYYTLQEPLHQKPPFTKKMLKVQKIVLHFYNDKGTHIKDRVIFPSFKSYEDQLPQKNKSDIAWGEEVEGLALRLRPAKQVITSKENGKFQLDLRNDRSQAFPASRYFDEVWLEFDGKWYHPGIDTGTIPYIEVKPGETAEPFRKFTFQPGMNKYWKGGWPRETPPLVTVKPSKTLILSAGSYNVCAAFRFPNKTKNKMVYAVSNSVEIEILPDEKPISSETFTPGPLYALPSKEMLKLHERISEADLQEKIVIHKEIVRQFQAEKDPKNKIQIMLYLRAFGRNRMAADTLKEILHNESNSDSHHMAAYLLGNVGNQQDLDFLLEVLRSEKGRSRPGLGRPGRGNLVDSAYIAISSIGGDKAAQILLDLWHSKEYVPDHALYSMGATGSPLVWDLLLETLENKTGRFRPNAAAGLSAFASRNQDNKEIAGRALTHLRKYVKDPNPEIRERVITGFYSIGQPQDIPLLEPLLNDPYSNVVTFTKNGQIKEKTVYRIREKANHAINKIKGRIANGEMKTPDALNDLHVWQGMEKQDQHLRSQHKKIKPGMKPTEVRTIMGIEPKIFRKNYWGFPLSPASNTPYEINIYLTVSFKDGKVSQTNTTYTCIDTDLGGP